MGIWKSAAPEARTAKAQYLMELRYWTANGAALQTRRIGLFWDDEDAMEAARRFMGEASDQIVRVRAESRWDVFKYRVTRVAIRSARVAAAAVIAFLLYAWLSDVSWQMGDTPLARLTLNMIFSSIFHGAAALFGGIGCWVLAFGEGPKENR